MTASSRVRLDVGRYQYLVRRFRGRRIAVVGDLMLDHFIRGNVSRTSPEAPVPVVVVDKPESFHLGGAGNVAANLAALGARPMVFGVIGEDWSAHTVRRELRRAGIDAPGLVRAPGRPTTTKTRIIAENQHVVRVDWEQSAPLAADLERRLLNAFRRHTGRIDGVVLSDYDKGVLTENFLSELLEVCSVCELPVFMDLKKPRPLAHSLALLLMNQRRAEEISGLTIDDEKTLKLVGDELMHRFPCYTLIITRAAKGMVVFEQGNSHKFAAVRTRPWEVFDVTGAGDTVISALSLALVSGASSQEAAVIANSAAGIVVGKLGTAACTPRELLQNLNGNRHRQ